MGQVKVCFMKNCVKQMLSREIKFKLRFVASQMAVKLNFVSEDLRFVS